MATSKHNWPKVVLLSTAPAIAAVVILIWSERDGGFPATSWYPGGLVIAALVGVQALGRSLRLAWDPPTAAAGALLALGAFEGLSVAWAGQKGEAWDSANRTLVYALVFILFAGWRAARSSKHLFALAFVMVMAIVAISSLASASHNVSSDFLFGRLTTPTGYPNATAALFLISFWPAVSLAAGREKGALFRAAALGSAALLAAVAYVPESRGAAYTFPIVAIVYLALSPLRIRAFLFVVLALAPVAALVHTFSAPWAARTLGGRATAAHHAVIAAAVCGAIAALLGAASSLVERRVEFSLPLGRRTIRTIGAVALAVTAVGFAATYHPRAVIDNAWASFKSSSDGGGSGTGTRFGGLGSNRYDFWRVALQITEHHPVVGAGAGNFSELYLQQRRSHEQPQYPHSIELSILSQTGAIGSGLFVLFLAFVGLSVLRGRRDPEGSIDALTAGAATAWVSWIAHASVDWLWEFPALGASAFLFLGLASSSRATNDGKRTLRLGAIALAATIGVSLVGPWVAARQVAEASAVWHSDPTLAYSLLKHASRFNPVSDEPEVVEATIAAELGDAARMEAGAKAAINRDPHNWFSRLQLAVVLAHEREWDRAERQAVQAQRLDPAEPLVTTVLDSIRSRRPLGLRTANNEVLRRLEILDPRLR